MWAIYNYSKFPIVNVKFNGRLEKDNQYYDFIKHWTLLYSKKKKYKFIFDTTNCGYINIKYAFKIPSFIKKLKEFPIQYLEKSIIIYNNNFIKYFSIVVI